MSKFLVPFLLVVIAIALFVSFTQPLTQTITTTKAEADSLNQLLGSASELATVRDVLLKKYNTISNGDLAKLDSALPDQVDNVHLIIDVNSIASKYGMTLRNAVATTNAAASGSSAIGPSAKKYSVVKLSFQVTGSYNILKQFLTDLNNSLRITDVTSTSFTGTDRDQNDYTIELETYWYQS
jgi:Tfp pilus assembly protein PilO